MKICIPVAKNSTENNSIYGHFGSAPFFAVLDTETGTVDVQPNSNSHDEHGMCNPVKTIESFGAEALVVEGIGINAVKKLQSAGIRVLKATSADFTSEISNLKSGKLQDFEVSTCCGGHHNH